MKDNHRFILATGFNYLSYGTQALILFIINNIYDDKYKNSAGIVLTIIGLNYLLLPILFSKIQYTKTNFKLVNFIYIGLTFLLFIVLYFHLSIYLIMIIMFFRSLLYTYKITFLKDLIHDSTNTKLATKNEKNFIFTQQFTYSVGLIIMGLLLNVINNSYVFLIDMVFSSFFFLFISNTNKFKEYKTKENNNNYLNFSIIKILKGNKLILASIFISFLFYQQDASINSYLMSLISGSSKYTGFISICCTFIGITFTSFITKKNLKTRTKVLLATSLIFIGTNLLPLAMSYKYYMFITPLLKGLGVTLLLSNIIPFLFSYMKEEKENIHKFTFLFQEASCNISNLVLLNTFIAFGYNNYLIITTLLYIIFLILMNKMKKEAFIND